MKKYPFFILCLILIFSACIPSIDSLADPTPSPTHTQSPITPSSTFTPTPKPTIKPSPTITTTPQPTPTLFIDLDEHWLKEPLGHEYYREIPIRDNYLETDDSYSQFEESLWEKQGLPNITAQSSEKPVA